jgi:pentatricopeptide repeat protein
MANLKMRSRKLTSGLLLLTALLVAGCNSPEENAQAYYKSGMELIGKNDDLAARLELLKAVKYKSDMVEVWRALAGIDERTKGDSLFLDLRRVVELDPSDLDARVGLARIMVKGGAADAALKLLSVANDEQMPNAGLHLLKSSIYLRTKEMAEAVREAERALEIAPGSVDAIALIAAKKVTDGDPDGALRLLESVPDDAKGEMRITLQKVQIFIGRHDLAKAEELLRGLIARNPDQITLHQQFAQLLIAQKRFNDAETELRAIADRPDADSKVGLDLVKFLGATKGIDAARTELRSRITVGGDVFDYQLMLAELEFMQSKGAEGIEQLKSLADSANSAERKLAAQAKLAELLVSRSDLAAAEPVIAEILTADRRNATALRLRAAIRIEQGKFDDAITDLREALNDQSKSTELLMLLATAYERSGKSELADRQYADALKSSNLDPRVGVRYAEFLQRRGDRARAEDMLSEVASRSPRDLDVLATLAQVKLSRENWSGTLSVADDIARLGGSKVISEQIRAAALAGQNKPDESITALKVAHEAAPDAIQPVVSLVSAYAQSGKTDQAELLLNEMLKKFPNNAQLWVMKGQNQLTGNRSAEAERSFQSAVELQPKDPSGYIGLSDLYARQKNYEAATTIVQDGLKQRPGDTGLRYAWAGLLIQKGDTEAAMAQYEDILKSQPGSLLAINNLVSLILDNRTDAESIQRATALAEGLKSATVPQFQDTYGWALYKRGDAVDSISILEAAQAKLPKLASVQYHLGMSYTGIGQADKAAEHFKTALQLEPEGTALKATIRAALK